MGAENGHLSQTLTDEAYARISTGEADGFDRLMIITHEEGVRIRRDLSEAIRDEGQRTRKLIHEESSESRSNGWGKREKVVAGVGGSGLLAGVGALIWELAQIIAQRGG